MTVEELEWWAQDFEAFHERFADLFARRESREQASKYLRGLLGGVERKNSWQLAEATGDQTPDGMQRLLANVAWDEGAARDRLQQYIIETFGEADGIGIVDETGFLKKGQASAGVGRQYSGTAGKVENCQIGVFLSYATSKGHVFLDRALYLPEAWCQDKARREQAKIPADVGFQPKPEQALAMLERAWANGVPMKWVTGDEVYGDASYLRDGIRAHGRWYVLAVSCDTLVWDQPPPLVAPRHDTGGRPQRKPRLAQDAPPPQPVAALVAAWPQTQWERFSVADGEKGPRLYDWGRIWVSEAREGLPGPAGWLLARRSVSDPTDTAFYLAHAPKAVSLFQLARVAACRYTVEHCFEEAKGEVGLDHYQVRFWHSWYRHITLALMAHTWLAAIRLKAQPKKGAWPRSWPT